MSWVYIWKKVEREDVQRGDLDVEGVKGWDEWSCDSADLWRAIRVTKVLLRNPTVFCWGLGLRKGGGRTPSPCVSSTIILIWYILPWSRVFTQLYRLTNLQPHTCRQYEICRISFVSNLLMLLGLIFFCRDLDRIRIRHIFRQTQVTPYPTVCFSRHRMISICLVYII